MNVLADEEAGRFVFAPNRLRYLFYQGVLPCLFAVLGAWLAVVVAGQSLGGFIAGAIGTVIGMLAMVFLGFYGSGSIRIIKGYIKTERPNVRFAITEIDWGRSFEERGFIFRNRHIVSKRGKKIGLDERGFTVAEMEVVRETLVWLCEQGAEERTEDPVLSAPLIETGAG